MAPEFIKSITEVAPDREWSAENYCRQVYLVMNSEIGLNIWPSIDVDIGSLTSWHDSLVRLRVSKFNRTRQTSALLRMSGCVLSTSINISCLGFRLWCERIFSRFVSPRIVLPPYCLTPYCLPRIVLPVLSTPYCFTPYCFTPYCFTRIGYLVLFYPVLFCPLLFHSVLFTPYCFTPYCFHLENSVDNVLILWKLETEKRAATRVSLRCTMKKCVWQK